MTDVRRDFRRALALVPNAARRTGRRASVTELACRHQIRPVIQTGATVMDRFFEHREAGS